MKTPEGTSLPLVQDVQIVPHSSQLLLQFTSGATGTLDLESSYLWGTMFEALQTPDFFAQVTLQDGVLTWPNGVDLDPESVWDNAIPLEDDVFSAVWLWAQESAQHTGGEENLDD